MIQRHSIILWKKADNQDRNFDDIVIEAFNTLNILFDYPIEFRPNYETALSRNEVKEFTWSLENFKELLKKGINKEGDKVFHNLGSTISMFSSLSEDKSFSFELVVGNKDERFLNSLVINIPISFNLFDDKNADLLCEIFDKLVVKFDPFWGCISNKAIARNYEEYLCNGVPTTVFWLNYWGTEIQARVGSQTLNLIIEMFPDNYSKGVFRLQNRVLDADNDKDIEFHKQIESLLLLK